MSLSTCTRPMVVSAAGQITADNFSVDSRGHSWGNCKWGTRIIGRAAAVKSGTGEQEPSPALAMRSADRTMDSRNGASNGCTGASLQKHLPPIAILTCSFGDPKFLSDGERLPRLLDVDNMLLFPRRATTTSTEGGVQGRRVVCNVSNNLLGEDTPTPCHKISPGTSPTIKQVYDRLSCVRLIKNNDCSVLRCVIT